MARQIPYGMMNFVASREDNYFFFICPRRFGKSLTMSNLKPRASETEVQAAVEQAMAQVCRYADSVNVNDNIATTMLHRVYVVYRGVEMVGCEEVNN